MRKVLSLITALVMCLSLCACSGGASVNAVVPEATAAPEPTPVVTPEPTPEPTPEFVNETAHCTLDGVYVDRSFKDGDNPNMKMVYVLYTVFTNDKNLQVSSKLSKLEFETGNSYSSEHFSKGSQDYMPNYYSKNYLTDVYIGDKLKVMSAFQVPEAEFSASELITIKPQGLPVGEELRIKADDVKFFDSAAELAKAADPEGYTQAMKLREPADEATAKKVKNGINGYYWTFYVNSTSYQLEFFSPNKFELRVSALGVNNGGKYEVQNGFVVCTYDSNGAVVEIPWTMNGDEVDLDVISAFSVGG